MLNNSNIPNQILNKTNKIEWILNLNETELVETIQESNMRPIPLTALTKLMGADYLVSGNIYTYVKSLRKFTMNEFWLFPNMLVQLDSTKDETVAHHNGSNKRALDTSQYLILSSCFMDKKTLHFEETQALGIKLYSSLGQCDLFFESSNQLIEWYTHLKRFCKLRNFLNKFKVREKLQIPNAFICVKNKTNRLHTVQIFRNVEIIQNSSSLDAIMNEIMILMSFKHPALLNYQNLYEDKNHMYILYEYWDGIQLNRFISNGSRLSQTQIAMITQQLFKFCRFLHQNQIYHGAITPQNIILLKSSQESTIDVVVFNFSYRESNPLDYSWLRKRIPINWLPPELFDESQSIDPTKIDSYLLGWTLFYMISFKPSNLRNNESQFFRTVENFNFSYSDFQNIQNAQRSQFDETSAVSSIDIQRFRSSQLNLLLGLLDPNPNTRLQLSDACNHHWFVNTKRQISLIEQEKILPSLKTILELRDSSSQDLQSHVQSQKILIKFNIQDTCLPDACIDDSHDNIHRISNEDNYLFVYMRLLQGITGIRHPRSQQNVF